VPKRIAKPGTALREGLIDCVATDHAPHADFEKEREFDHAPFGIIGFETAFPVLYTELVLKDQLSLERLVEVMSLAPAKLLHLGDKSLTEGNTADMVIVDSRQNESFPRYTLSKSKKQPRGGHDLQCCIQQPFAVAKPTWEPDGKRPNTVCRILAALSESSYSILVIIDDEIAGRCEPGNFVEIKPYKAGSVLKRLFKPISIYKVESNSIFLMIKALGRGSKELTKLNEGDMVELIAPLGNSFPMPNGKSIALVSGGIGYPPLWFLKSRLNADIKVRWFHGGACEKDIFPCDESVAIDGSAGTKGLVTQGLVEWLKDKIFQRTAFYSWDRNDSPSPPPTLLKCSGSSLRILTLSPFTSQWKAYMACGVGVCHEMHGSNRHKRTLDKYLRVCKDGPVFDARDLRWELI
jgi:NAD(P)H-flavin reductase